jgi:hypothetical protein
MLWRLSLRIQTDELLMIPVAIEKVDGFMTISILYHLTIGRFSVEAEPFVVGKVGHTSHRFYAFFGNNPPRHILIRTLTGIVCNVLF